MLVQSGNSVHGFDFNSGNIGSTGNPNSNKKDVDGEGNATKDSPNRTLKSGYVTDSVQASLERPGISEHLTK